jgi:hypothetical protein
MNLQSLSSANKLANILQIVRYRPLASPTLNNLSDFVNLSRLKCPNSVSPANGYGVQHIVPLSAKPWEILQDLGIGADEPKAMMSSSMILA